MLELRGGFGRDIIDLQREMERFLGHLAQGKRPLATLAACSWNPAIDVYETADEVVVLIEAAGVREEDVGIVLDGRTLLVHGQRRPRVRSQRPVYHQLEVGFGYFERALELPVPVDPDRARASYENGFIEIVMPKVDVTIGRRVDIKSRSSK